MLFVKPGGGTPVTRVNGEDTRLIAGDASTRGAYAARLNSAPARFNRVPRGAPHAIANAGGEAVRWLTLISPAGQAGWVEAEHELLAEGGGEPDPERLAEIHRRFGLELVGPPPPLPAGAGSQLPLR